MLDPSKFPGSWVPHRCRWRGSPLAVNETRVFLTVVHRVSSSLLGPVNPSFRAFSGRLKFTVRRHNSNQDSLVCWQQNTWFPACHSSKDGAVWDDPDTREKYAYVLSLSLSLFMSVSLCLSRTRSRSRSHSLYTSINVHAFVYACMYTLIYIYIYAYTYLYL